MPKIAVSHARRDDQVIVPQRAILQLHLLCLEIESHHLALQHAGVLLPLEHVAQRRTNVCRRQTTGRHLIQQWLKQVVVLSIDQRHLGIHAAERERRI